jgi:signal peptidase I
MKIEKIIEQSDNEIEKTEKYMKINNKRLIINLIIVVFSTLVIFLFPNKITDLMPSILSDLKILLIISLLMSLCFIVMFTFKKSFKFINTYSFQKNFFSFYDYFSYFVNTISIIFTFMIIFITPSVVDGDSMKNTLKHSDNVFVYHFLYKPEKNDIVVINSTPYRKNWSNLPVFNEVEYYVKRCVAVKNDKIEFILKDNEYIIEINDKKIENLVISSTEKEKILNYNEVKIENNIIKSDHALVISDNKNIPTVDSRLMGFIKYEDVIGKVVIRFYPFSEFKIF